MNNKFKELLISDLEKVTELDELKHLMIRFIDVIPTGEDIAKKVLNGVRKASM